MKRTTVFLEDKLLRDLKRLAEKRGVSFATVVREAAAAYVVEPVVGKVPSIAGQFASGKRDTAERAHELLWNDPHA
jgi:hypothetical protein